MLPLVSPEHPHGPLPHRHPAATLQSMTAIAHAALLRAVDIVEQRIAPLWTKGLPRLSRRDEVVRLRVTLNCLRELDLLLAHCHDEADPRRRTDAVDAQRRREQAGGKRPARFTSHDLIAIAARHRRGAERTRAA